MTPGDGSRRWLWPVGAVLAIITAIMFSSLAGNDFINYDDPLYITECAMVQQGMTWSGVKWAFTTIEAFNWHPVTWLSHMLDVQLFGVRPGPHHWMSLSIHIANAVVLLVLLWQMTEALWRSALVAALFAWHPLHVESVAWVAERKDMLSTLFGLLAIMAYVRWVKNGEAGTRRTSVRIIGYLWILWWFALSLMSKPMLVTLPCVLLLLDFWPLNRWRPTGTPLRTLLLEKVPLLGLTIASSAMTVYAQSVGGAVMALDRLPLTERLINAVVAYAAYLGKMIWPVRLAVLYPHPGSWPWSTIVLSAAVLIAVTVAVLMWRRRQPALLVGWLWYLGTLVPVIGLVQVGQQSMADRYTYVPLIGVFIMIVWAAGEMTTRLNRVGKIAVGATAVVVLLVLSLTTMWQASHWRNNETLYRRALEVTADNFILRTNLGVHYRRSGDPLRAEVELAEALRVNDRYAIAHDNMGITLIDLKRPAEAVVHLERAISLDPRASRPYNNLSSALGDLGRWDEAIAAMNRAIELEPGVAAYQSNLGNLLIRASRAEEAIAVLTKATAMNPSSAAAWSGLGTAHLTLRQVEPAIAALNNAVRLQPDHATTHVDLGVALAAGGKLDEAIVQFQEAIRLDPAHRKAHELLELASKQKGQSAP